MCKNVIKAEKLPSVFTVFQRCDYEKLFMFWILTSILVLVKW